MARPQNRKRQRVDEFLTSDRPAKASRREQQFQSEHPIELSTRGHSADEDERINSRDPTDPPAWRGFPPQFWDHLSEIPLTRSALEEFDRRVKTQPTLSNISLCPPRPSRTTIPLTSTQALTLTSRPTPGLARFARTGGPDLRDLREYPSPGNTQQRATISSPSSSKATGRTDPTTISKSGTSKTKRSAYGPAFEQHLVDHDIYTRWESRKPDLKSTHASLRQLRLSLSPSRFSDGEFEKFCRIAAQAKNEIDVITNVIPIITGAPEANYPTARNIAMAHLEPLTNNTVAAPQPDIYWGAKPQQLDLAIREELGKFIVPSTAKDLPIVPNFCMEVKGPKGFADVMMRQARYDGAVGARSIHVLNNYGRDKPVYDGKVYAYSATYHGGTDTLQLFAHHITAPLIPDGRPEYHITQLRTFGMTDTRDTFVEGATAFRNARDLAKQNRDKSIGAANAVHRSKSRGAQDTLISNPAQDESGSSSGSDEFLDCETWNPYEDDRVARLSAEHNSQTVPSQTYESDSIPSDTAASFATSFTSTSIRAPSRRSKRPRDSHSPTSSSSHSKKNGSSRRK